MAFFPRTAKELKVQELYVDSVPLKYSSERFAEALETKEENFFL